MDQTSRHVARVRELLRSSDWTLAVAESMTGGAIASVIGQSPDAGTWFQGGIIASSPRTMFDVLHVPPGPVVSQRAACAMADAAAQLFGADVALAATGVGGPGPEGATAPGTVWIAIRHPHGTEAQLQRFPGSPREVLDQTVAQAVELLAATCSRLVGGVHGNDDVAPPPRERPASLPVAGDLAVTPTWSSQG